MTAQLLRSTKFPLHIFSRCCGCHKICGNTAVFDIARRMCCLAKTLAVSARVDDVVTVCVGATVTSKITITTSERRNGEKPLTLMFVCMCVCVLVDAVLQGVTTCHNEYLHSRGCLPLHNLLADWHALVMYVCVCICAASYVPHSFVSSCRFLICIALFCIADASATQRITVLSLQLSCHIYINQK